MKRIIVIVIGLTVLAILSIVIYFSFQKSKSPLPEQYTGNWINENTNNWEYGFFEEFAIYESDFWDYYSVNFDNENQVEITLKNGKNELKLQLVSINPSQIKIISEKGEENFILMSSKYPNYPTKDTGFFSTPTFEGDSATIIGYYRNLDKGLKGFAQRFFPSPFEIAIGDFLSGEEMKYYADIDKSGRFKITFPVLNTQEVWVDWKRTRLRAVVEPGDILFLFVDINDYVPTNDDKQKNYENYIDRSKQVLYMGKNARLNNEIHQYKSPWISINRSEWKNLSDLEYLQKCEDVYQRRVELLNEYIEKNPTVSDKFRYYEQTREKYEFASYLMQHYYDLDRGFQDGYIQYIEDFFPLDDELTYTFTRDFVIFLHDYIFYKDYKSRGISPNDADSLITNPNLRELWTTNRYNYWFKVLRKPLSIHQQEVFKQKVTNPYLRNYIDAIQKHYGDVANMGVSYDASLKNTENLKEYKDADELLKKLIEPYKGKVIYADFWATWCRGCRENMKYVNDLKKQLQGEDVVFMYFASDSPEGTWKNIIKEFDLTGENVVHYRLPNTQQGMIERKLSVYHFPTYILIDKKGNIVNTDAAQPANANEAIRQIKELSK